MKVYLYDNPYVDKPPQLALHPENAREAALLDVLERLYELSGMGRDPDTGDILHAEIALKRKGEVCENRFSPL